MVRQTARLFQPVLVLRDHVEQDGVVVSQVQAAMAQQEVFLLVELGDATMVIIYIRVLVQLRDELAARRVIFRKGVQEPEAAVLSGFKHAGNFLLNRHAKVVPILDAGDVQLHPQLQNVQVLDQLQDLDFQDFQQLRHAPVRQGAVLHHLKRIMRRRLRVFVQLGQADHLPGHDLLNDVLGLLRDRRLQRGQLQRLAVLANLDGADRRGRNRRGRFRHVRSVA